VKFQFGLEKVLDHRKTQEELAQRDFMVAQRAHDFALKEKSNMERNIVRARKSSFELQKKGGNEAHHLQSLEEFIVGETKRIRLKEVEIRKLHEILEAKRLIMIERGREFKVLEKLKSKKYAEFKKEKRQKEIKQIDDSVTMRFKGVHRYDQ
jgi:flagellar FliJ protein